MISDIPELTPEEEALWSASDDELDSLLKESQVEQPESDEEEEPEVVEDEQPTEDNSEEESEDEDSSDESAEEEENTEESEEESEEEPEVEETAEAKDSKESLKPVRANGMDIPVKSLDEVYQLASMGANYKKKMADIAPYRKSVSAMKENGLTEDDINLVIDAYKGNKDAVAAIIAKAGIDPLDIDMEESASKQYTPQQYGVDERQSEIMEIVQEISVDPEYTVTQKVIDSDWDSESRSILRDNPAMIKGLHEEIKNGNFAKVAPEALRLELLDGGKRSKLEYYLEAEKLYFESKRTSDESKREEAVKQTQRVVAKKRAAAPTRSKATNQQTSKDVDWVNMSDEEYEKFYNEVMRN